MKELYGNWIPVDVAMPPLTNRDADDSDVDVFYYASSDDVLITTSEGVTIGEYYGFNRDTGEEVWVDRCADDAATDVTAWMPLPEPYEEERRGEQECTKNI